MIFQLNREQDYAGGVTIVRMYIQPKRALQPKKQMVVFFTHANRPSRRPWRGGFS